VTALVPLVVLIPLFFGWNARQVMDESLVHSSASVAGWGLVAIAVVFMSLVVAESLTPDLRDRAARSVGVAAALTLVAMRVVEYRGEMGGDGPSLFDGPTLPIPVLTIVLAGVAILLWPRRRIASALGIPTRRRSGHLAAAAAGFFLLPFGILWVPNPFVLTDDSVGLVDREIAEVLGNTYRAFNLGDEMELYDRLSESVTTELLEDLYLDGRRRLSAGTVEGDEVTVGDVTLLAAEPANTTRAGVYDEAEYLARWSVTARVRHLQHVHDRQNLYAGTLRLRMEDGRWKLAAVRLTGEHRIITAVGIR